MAHYVSVDDTGRIQVTVENEEYTDDSYFVFDFPENFDFATQSDYRIVDGELVNDPKPPTEAEIAYAKDILRRAQLETATTMLVQNNAENLTDEQALSVSLLFEEYGIGKWYTQGRIIRYGDDLFRIGQAHTSQENWVPGSTGTEALYSKISISEDGYEDWKAWDGVTGLYNEDDIVRDPEDGLLYICISPNCTYGPPHSTPDFWKLYEGVS